MKPFISQNQPEPTTTFGSSYDIHMQAQAGVPVSLLQQVQLGLGVSLNDLAGLLSMSESTIRRYKQSNQPLVNPILAEQLILMHSLTEHGQSVFKKPGGFHQWLRTAQWDLNDKPPLLFLSTSQGIGFVNELLSRIEYGLPS